MHEWVGGPANFHARGISNYAMAYVNVGMHGEKSKADLDGANKFIGELTQFLLEEDIKIEDMDKTGLMWKAHKENTSTGKSNERKIKN